MGGNGKTSDDNEAPQPLTFTGEQVAIGATLVSTAGYGIIFWITLENPGLIPLPVHGLLRSIAVVAVGCWIVLHQFAKRDRRVGAGFANLAELVQEGRRDAEDWWMDGYSRGYVDGIGRKQPQEQPVLRAVKN